MTTNRVFLLKNGEIHDGTGAPAVRADVRISGSNIAEMGPNLSPLGADVIDASGLLVVPGLIDLHTHVFSGVGIYSVDPADAGLRTGVTTMLDTGTAGALTYPAFNRFVVPSAAEDVYALLNISMIGVIQGNPDVPPFMGDLNDARHAHVPSALACLQKYSDRILGTKVRLTAGLANFQEANERAGLSGTLDVAARAERFCMIHHIRSNIPVDEVLGRLRPGDIYTHLYHPHADHGFDNFGKPRAALRAARDRGVLFDVGHGSGAFSWKVGEPACREFGFWPDTISTDLHQFNLRGPVFDLPTTLSKFLHLGMSLPNIIRAATYTPAKAMGLDRHLGRLLPGLQADITLLRLVPRQRQLMDSTGEVRTANSYLEAVSVCKRGQWHACRSS